MSPIPTSTSMRWSVVVALLLVLTGMALVQADNSVPQGDVARGEEIYQANCAMCHGTDATGTMGRIPALTGVVERLSVEGVEITIRNGRDTRPPMPAFGNRLDATDIGDLITYLTGLPDGPRNLASDPDGGMMRNGPMPDHMTGGNVALWIALVILASALSGLIGYRIAARDRADKTG